MEPAAGGRADIFRDVGREGDDIMVQGPLQFATTLDVESSARPNPLVILFGHDSLDAKRFAGEKFDLQPELELSLFAPNFAHGRTRVALNHGQTVSTTWSEG